MSVESDYDLKARQERLQQNNRMIAVFVFLVASGMVGMSYAAVPLYQLFCQVTGFEGTTQRADKPSDTIVDHKVRIRFVSYVTQDLEWDFQPMEKTADIKLGENKLVYYKARNTSSQTLVGTAKYKVLPEIMGSYFNKTECFCFTEQKLEPGQEIKMPVSFFVDPDVIKDASARGVEEITLSYTFRPVRAEVSEVKRVKETEKSKSADL